jgi:hypothetical protein
LHHTVQTSGGETIDSTSTTVNKDTGATLPTGGDMLSSTIATVPTTANINKATEPATTTDKDTAATVADAGKTLVF